MQNKITPSEFIKSSLVTESRDMSPVSNRLQNNGTVRLLHSMIGLCTESGEIQDMMKKHIFYGKDIDKVNLKEELGDLMWYIAIACDEIDISLEEVMQTNVDKLRARYGEKFTEEAALNRNLLKEREILEK